MTKRKFTSSEKILVTFIINALLFGGVFALKVIGVSSEYIMLVLAALVSLEVIYLVIFVQMFVNKNTNSLEEVKEHIKDIKEDEEKAHNILIYLEHQMKAI